MAPPRAERAVPPPPEPPAGLLALLVGLLFAVGVYLLLARDPVRLVLALIGNAATLCWCSPSGA